MNTKILLNERPHGEPNLGNFKTVKEDIRTPNDGEVLLKTIYMSLDPYMRGRMNDAKSYAKLCITFCIIHSASHIRI